MTKKLVSIIHILEFHITYIRIRILYFLIKQSENMFDFPKTEPFKHFYNILSKMHIK